MTFWTGDLALDVVVHLIDQSHHRLVVAVHVNTLVGRACLHEPRTDRAWILWTSLGSCYAICRRLTCDQHRVQAKRRDEDRTLLRKLLPELYIFLWQAICDVAKT